jgi:hypothetical protein
MSPGEWRELDSNEVGEIKTMLRLYVGCLTLIRRKYRSVLISNFVILPCFVLFD